MLKIAVGILVCFSVIGCSHGSKNEKDFGRGVASENEVERYVKELKAEEAKFTDSERYLLMDLNKVRADIEYIDQDVKKRSDATQAKIDALENKLAQEVSSMFVRREKLHFTERELKRQLYKFTPDSIEQKFLDEVLTLVGGECKVQKTAEPATYTITRNNESIVVELPAEKFSKPLLKGSKQSIEALALHYDSRHEDGVIQKRPVEGKAFMLVTTDGKRLLDAVFVGKRASYASLQEIQDLIGGRAVAGIDCNPRF